MKDVELAHIVEQLSMEPEESLTLQQVVDQAVRYVPGCDMGSVFVRRNGTVEIAATTDPSATRVDDLQFEFDEGPCLSVLQEHEIASVPDTATDDRWPRWSDGAVEHGVRSALSLRLAIEEPYLACLNMYSREPRGFDGEAVDLGVVYARLASVAILQAREVSGLRSALNNRLIIGAAQGILMERYGLSLNRSFEVLRRRSNETNTKLHDVAQGLVDGLEIRD
ncbi:GAF and ANTAR domain-containing protein [Janibacter terrae]|uniref:GAF and ANTAR domain-containing protein n=1 Tax=Janibacter terrae TaxID=103817 RepID=A0ABZ2FCR7_9MICO